VPVAEAWLRLGLFGSWPFFLLGGIGLVVYRRWRSAGVTGVFDGRRWTPVMVALAIGCFLLTTYAQDTPSYFVLGYVLTGVGLAVALNAIPYAGPMMRSIGRYSYFIYFFHFWVLRWLENRYRDSSLPETSTSIAWNVGVLIAMFVIALAMSWAVGWVSWRVLERPALNLAHRAVR
jgi:peptidoglycan/LPS O-acetylase OafA/YrhL